MSFTAEPLEATTAAPIGQMGIAPVTSTVLAEEVLIGRSHYAASAVPLSDVHTRRFDASQTSRSVVSYTTGRADSLRKFGPKPVIRSLLRADSARPVYSAAADTEIRDQLDRL